MKKPLSIITIFLIGINLLAQNQFDEDLKCTNGTMDIIKIEIASDTKKIKNLKRKRDFYINVDTENKSENFVSDVEQHFRTESVKIDTINIAYERDWKYFTAEQKLKIAKRKREEAKNFADKIHKETNLGQQMVSLTNYTRKDIYFPSICGVPVIVLQAKDIEGYWKTIRFIQFAACGNCYSYTTIPKMSELEIIVELPKNGNLKTKLRFKMLLNNEFIYSNEFDYTINQCDFLENSVVENNCFNCEPNTSNKLEIEATEWKY
jgi:hypothetical protein